MPCHRKLDAGDVRRIRAALALGYPGRQLAATYGVSPGTIRKIRDGETHKGPEAQVPPPRP
jgi:DNA-binding transcriptional regulator YiaG